MYLPKDFVLGEAVACGELIDQAYQQFDLKQRNASPDNHNLFLYKHLASEINRSAK